MFANFTPKLYVARVLITLWLSDWFVNVDLLLINIIYFGAYLYFFVFEIYKRSV